jgi:P-type Ca2+ transporter type 2C
MWGVVMKWYEMEVNEVEKSAGTDHATGLSDKEAQKRLKHYGENKLDEGEKPSGLLVFLRQFKDFMVLVLLAATLISGLIPFTFLIHSM